MTEPAAEPKLVVLDHPLIHDKLARLRDHTTKPDAFLPEAMVGHIGLYRDHETLLPREYLVKLPTEIAKREVLVRRPRREIRRRSAHQRRDPEALGRCACRLTRP